MSAAAAPRRDGGRVTELDALRLVMVAVVLFHAWQQSTGDIGLHAYRDYSLAGIVIGNLDVLLAVFFSLGGLALYYPLAQRVIAGKPLERPRTWLAQRLLRLLPLYYVLFLATWFLRYNGSTDQWYDLLWGGTLMQAWSSERIFRTIDPGWYLSVELHLALATALFVLPALRALSKVQSARRRMLGLAVPPLAFIALGVAWRTTLAIQGVPFDRWGQWFAPPAWAAVYGFGMLFGLAMAVRPPARWVAPRPVGTLLFVMAFSWFAYLQSVRGLSTLSQAGFYDLSTLGALALFAGTLASPPDGLVRRVMRSRVMQAVAAASYATFLVHAPVLRSLAARDILPMDAPAIWPYAAAATLVVSFVLGHLVHRYVQQPLDSMAKLARPKFQRATAIRRSTPSTIAAGDQLPPAVLEDEHGRTHRLDQLGAGGMAIVLFHATGHLPADPRIRAGLGADRALDSLRPAAGAHGLTLASVTTTPIRRGDDGDDASLGRMVRVIDPAAGWAKQIGVGTFTTIEGRNLLEAVVLVVDAQGVVQHVLRGDDAPLLLNRALGEATGGGDAPPMLRAA